MQLDAIRDVQIESAEGWRKLWGQAVQERDPNRLMKLLAQTNDLLDQGILSVIEIFRQLSWNLLRGIKKPPV